MYTGLCLSGGGIKGITQLGVLQRYYTENKLKNIKIGIGTSVGSIICYLLFIGYTPSEIFTEACEFDFPDLTINISSITRKFGLIDIELLLQRIEELTLKRMEYVPNLKELYENFGKELIVVTYNLSKHVTEYLNYKSNPELSCIDAIKLSCSIPLLFEKCVYNNNIYVDGALSDNFPIEWLDNYINREQSDDILDDILLNGTVKDIGKNILGINLYISDRNMNNNTIFDYVKNILVISLRKNCADSRDYLSPYIDVVTINSDGNALDIKCGLERKIELFNIGMKI